MRMSWSIALPTTSASLPGFRWRQAATRPNPVVLSMASRRRGATGGQVGLDWPLEHTGHDSGYAPGQASGRKRGGGLSLIHEEIVKLDRCGPNAKYGLTASRE